MAHRAAPLIVSLLALTALVFSSFALPAFAAKEELLDRARSLVEEARPYNRRAGDTDLNHGERKKARRETYKRLKEARSLYDDYLDANPGKEEQFDREYCEVASMLYWVKKMASLREFDEEPERETPRPTPPKPAPEKPAPEKPAPGKPTPEKPDAGTEEGAALPDYETQLAQLARARYAELQEIKAANPGDVPRIHAAYEQFLADFELPDLAEYQKAALELGQLADRMKTVFKEQVGADPEAHPDTKKKLDSKNLSRVLARLSKDMRNSDETVRRRSARLLGQLGSGAGSFVLARALMDKDADVARIAKEGLVNIGGSRACYNLIKLYRDSATPARQHDCVDIFKAISAKSEVDAIGVSVPLGRFVLSRNQDVAGEALDFLVSLGPPGGPGLVEALATRMPAKKLEVIRGLGTVKHYPAALQLGRYLLQGDNKTMVKYRGEAKTALHSMGIRAVPYLIPLLGSKRHKIHTSLQLREMTGAVLPSKTKHWKKWWKENKPADAE